MTRFFSSKAAQHDWKLELGKAFKKVGLPLGGSFFNPPFEWLMPEAAPSNAQVALTSPFGRKLPVLPQLRAVAPAVPSKRPEPGEPIVVRLN